MIGVGVPTLIRNWMSVSLMELILGMPIYIGCSASHFMLTKYFPYNLGPSIVKLSTDHIFQLSHFCLVFICQSC